MKEEPEYTAVWPYVPVPFLASEIKRQLFRFSIMNTGWSKRGKQHCTSGRSKFKFFIDEIDKCIKNYNDEALTLQSLSRRLGYSEFYTTRKFREISGMQFRDYLRLRRLAFALKEVRDSEKKFS